jgi:uncharacterized SAM-binding protein YcdF (DUF218 family)
MIFVMALGLGLMPMWRTKGLVVMIIGLIGLYLVSTPLVGSTLIRSLQGFAAIKPHEMNKLHKSADVIVVLAGGRRRNAPDYGGDTLSYFTLERVRYAAKLAKNSDLPLILSGGKLRDDGQSEAYLMQQVLLNEYKVEVKMIEEYSHTTYENAYYTASLLGRLNINRIVLVTHAWHMPRAVEAFEHFHIKVVPAPTAFEPFPTANGLELEDLFPQASSLQKSSLAIHEMIGRSWYRLRYY